MTTDPSRTLTLLTRLGFAARGVLYLVIGLLVLRRSQDDGHRPVALAGGATGMVGSALLRRLTTARIPVRCLVRDPKLTVF